MGGNEVTISGQTQILMSMNHTLHFLWLPLAHNHEDTDILKYLTNKDLIGGDVIYNILRNLEMNHLRTILKFLIMSLNRIQYLSFLCFMEIIFYQGLSKESRGMIIMESELELTLADFFGLLLKAV